MIALIAYCATNPPIKAQIGGKVPDDVNENFRTNFYFYCVNSSISYFLYNSTILSESEKDQGFGNLLFYSTNFPNDFIEL